MKHPTTPKLVQAAPPLITAAQIGSDACPAEVHRLGGSVAASLKKARGYLTTAEQKAGVELRKAEGHWVAATKYLAAAKALCDSDGFAAFQKKYCPDLSRSRIYEMLAIGSGKTTVEEARGATRERVTRHRANRQAESVTSAVTDSTTPEVAPEPFKLTPASAEVSDARTRYITVTKVDRTVRFETPFTRIGSSVHITAPDTLWSNEQGHVAPTSAELDSAAVAASAEQRKWFETEFDMRLPGMIEADLEALHVALGERLPQQPKPANADALTKAAMKISEAVKQAKLAYEFNASSHTASTLQACLAAAKALGNCINQKSEGVKP